MNTNQTIMSFSDFPLLYQNAIKENDLKSFESLMNFSDPSLFLHYIIPSICENENVTILDVLLQDKRVISNYFEMFKIACKNGSLKIVEKLSQFVNVNDDNIPIWLACKNGHTNIVKFLLPKLKNVAFYDSDGALLQQPLSERSALLCISCEHGHLEIVEMLLQYQIIDPTVFQNQPIRLAVLNGHYDVVKLLMKNANVNPADNDNEAIIIANQKGYTQIVNLLSTDSRVCQSVN